MEVPPLIMWKSPWEWSYHRRSGMVANIPLRGLRGLGGLGDSDLLSGCSGRNRPVFGVCGVVVGPVMGAGGVEPFRVCRSLISWENLGHGCPPWQIPCNESLNSRSRFLGQRRWDAIRSIRYWTDTGIR